VTRVPTEIRTFVVLGFRTTHEALEAESALLASGIDAVPIPSPKGFGALCGIAMRVPPDQEPAALESLLGAGIEPKARVMIEDRVNQD